MNKNIISCRSAFLLAIGGSTPPPTDPVMLAVFFASFLVIPVAVIVGSSTYHYFVSRSQKNFIHNHISPFTDKKEILYKDIFAKLKEKNFSSTESLERALLRRDAELLYNDIFEKLQEKKGQALYREDLKAGIDNYDYSVFGEETDERVFKMVAKLFNKRCVLPEKPLPAPKTPTGNALVGLDDNVVSALPTVLVNAAHYFFTHFNVFYLVTATVMITYITALYLGEWDSFCAHRATYGKIPGHLKPTCPPFPKTALHFYEVVLLGIIGYGSSLANITDIQLKIIFVTLFFVLYFFLLLLSKKRPDGAAIYRQAIEEGILEWKKEHSKSLRLAEPKALQLMQNNALQVLKDKQCIPEPTTKV